MRYFSLLHVPLVRYHFVELMVCPRLKISRQILLGQAQTCLDAFAYHFLGVYDRKKLIRERFLTKNEVFFPTLHVPLVRYHFLKLMVCPRLKISRQILWRAAGICLNAFTDHFLGVYDRKKLIRERFLIKIEVFFPATCAAC